MSTLPKFTRLSSPALAAHATSQGKPDLKTSTARMTALGMASTFVEIVEAVPITYREALKPMFLRLSEWTSKAAGARAVRTKLLEHKAKRTWPSQLLGNHLPKFELTKEFAETQPAQAQALPAAHAAFRAEALDIVIALKTAEVDWWNSRLSQAEIIPPMRRIIDETYETMEPHNREPTWVMKGDGTQGVGELRTSDLFKYEYECLVKDLAAFCSRISLIQLAKINRGEAKRKAKRELKDTADVEMGDATMSSRAISDLVAKEVAAALKKANLGSGVSLLSSVDEKLSHSHLGKRKWVDFQDSDDEEGQGNSNAREERRRRQSQVVLEPIVQDSPISQVWEEIGGRQRQREAEAIVAAANIRYEHPDSYPDEILLIPAPLAIRYLLRSAHPAVLEASRFRAGVHLGPGVTIPSHLTIHLSAGLKYMFPSRVNFAMIMDAWDDFVDRLRWRCHWTIKEAEGTEPRPYDPDYEVSHVRNRCEYREQYIEDGIEKGRAYIAKYMREAEPKLKSLPNSPEVVEMTELRKFLANHNYIVLPTDKNLGTAVVTRQWFIDGSLALLSDQQNYRKITSVERSKIINAARTSAVEAAAFALEYLEHPQLAEFLRSKVPDDEKVDPSVPRFYGIPKIHKTPVKMRPIVPCHSAPQNPAAKYVSKMLKPMLAERPFLLRSSKDLAQKLATLRVPRNKKIWLVSGDIVAFYPTVPTDRCIEIVKEWWLTFVGDSKSTAEKHIFLRCLRFALRDLICDFMDETYLQVQGLAMGVVCSPDLANLYAAYFEEKVLPNERFLFFGRFIDDVLGVVVADSEQEAPQIASIVSYESVKLDWSVSEWQAPFLDLLVYIDPVTNQVEHKPFRKARNNLERIPWASHHPTDVKKGTFIGEMSRLATLSSKPEHYLEALKDLASLYVVRGYPVNLVKHWLKEYTAIRWRSKHLVNLQRRETYLSLNPDLMGLGACSTFTFLDRQSYLPGLSI